MFSTTDNGQAESVVHYVLWGRGEGGRVLGFWGDHISHGFQGERGGAVVSNKVYRGDYKKFPANKEGGGGHKNITEP